jgi:RecA/RadA recombinase
MSDEIGAVRGYVGTRNIALDRALGVPGIPLGRLTEISGWMNAGKSTALDQILAETQTADDGIAVLADVERARDRTYMEALGVQAGLVPIKGATIEEMFSEIETLIRKKAHASCMGWVEALRTQKVKVPEPYQALYEVPNPDDPTKTVAKYHFARWGREQAAALMEFQAANGLPGYGLRDRPSREALRPYVLYSEFARDARDIEEARESWAAGDESHPLTRNADRPMVVGWDSIAGSASQDEMDHNAYESRQSPAVAARVIKYNFRRLMQLFDDEAVAFIIVNQRYQVIMQKKGYGGPTSETYGGGGIKYHSTIRIELDKVGDVWARHSDAENQIPPMGQIVRIKVPKNKVNSPFAIENYGLIFGRGADNAWALHEDFKNRGIISVAGGWSKFSDQSVLGEYNKSFAGWKGLSNLIAEHPSIWTKLKVIFHEGRGVGR